MRKLDASFYWLLGYFISYFLLLKVIPVTMGSLTLALLFVLIIENLSFLIGKWLKLRRGFLILISSLIFYGILIYSIYSIFPIVMKEGSKLLEYLQTLTSQSPDNLFSGIKNEKIAKMLSDMLSWAGKTFTTYAGEIAKTIFSKAAAIITSVTLLVIASTYLAAILPKLKRALPYMFPKSSLEKTEDFLRDLYSDMKKFVGGQMINAAIVGTIVWAGMAILGMKYSGFLGLLAGITDFIPFLGVFITAIPAIFIGTSQYGLWGVVGAIIVLTIANQIEGWILAPKILGDRVKLNWFLVLITMLALSEIYGFIGVLVSVPFLIISRGIWREFIAKALSKS